MKMLGQLLNSTACSTYFRTANGEYYLGDTKLCEQKIVLSVTCVTRKITVKCTSHVPKWDKMFH